MTFEELKRRKFVEHHKCAVCGVPVGYEIHPYLAVALFNSTCDCSENEAGRALTHEELEAIPS